MTEQDWSPATAVAHILQNAGVGSMSPVGEWRLLVGRELPHSDGFPKIPHTTITLYDTGGFNSRNSWSEEYPTVQARVRGAPNDYPAGYAKAHEIKRVVKSTNLAPVGGWRYSLDVIGDVMHIGFDDEARPVFTVQIKIMRSEET